MLYELSAKVRKYTAAITAPTSTTTTTAAIPQVGSAPSEKPVEEARGTVTTIITSMQARIATYARAPTIMPIR